MSSTSLREFVSLALESRRIRFADLRRLQRDVLPARITTREEVEMLIELDGAVQRADPDWQEYLIVTVRDFVVWGLPPAGRLDREKAEWLAATLSRGGATKTSRIIAREIAREARHISTAQRTGAVLPALKTDAKDEGGITPSGNAPAMEDPAARSDGAPRT